MKIWAYIQTNFCVLQGGVNDSSNMRNESVQSYNGYLFSLIFRFVFNHITLVFLLFGRNFVYYGNFGIGDFEFYCIILKFIGRINMSTEIWYNKTTWMKVFGVDDFEYHIIINKFKMADPIWWPKSDITKVFRRNFQNLYDLGKVFFSGMHFGLFL